MASDDELLVGSGESSVTSVRALAVPTLRTGFRAESWIDLPPGGLVWWERALLQPYSLPKDAVYYVVCPNSALLLHRCGSFLRELSCCYQRWYGRR